MLPVCFVQDDRLVTAAGTPPDAAQIAQIQAVAADENNPANETAAEYLTYLLDMGLIKKPKPATVKTDGPKTDGPKTDGTTTPTNPQ